MTETLTGRAPIFTDDSDDGDLIAAHRSGDPRAFSQIVNRYQRPIHRLALRWAHDADEADELTQRTFLRLLAHIDDFQGNQLKSYLFRIAANLCKNHLRDRARLVFGLKVEPTTPAVGGEALELTERRMLLRRLMARLPNRQRQVVTLRIDGELPFAEVARTLGITENSAKVNFHHAVRRLRLMMETLEKQEGKWRRGQESERGLLRGKR